MWLLRQLRSRKNMNLMFCPPFCPPFFSNGDWRPSSTRERAGRHLQYFMFLWWSLYTVVFGYRFTTWLVFVRESESTLCEVTTIISWHCFPRENEFGGVNEAQCSTICLDDSVFHAPKCQCWLNTSRFSGRQNRKGPLKMTQTIIVFSRVRKILPVSLFLAQASLVGRHCVSLCAEPFFPLLKTQLHAYARGLLRLGPRQNRLFGTVLHAFCLVPTLFVCAAVGGKKSGKKELPAINGGDCIRIFSAPCFKGY